MGNFYGYHRISSSSQCEDRGILLINSFCKERGITLAHEVFVDKISGKIFDRPHYNTLKECILRPNDTIIFAELDRMGRDYCMLAKEMAFYRENNIRVMILEIPTTTIDIDFESPMHKMLFDCIQNLTLDLLSVFADIETRKRTERQRTGLLAMKERGDWDKMGRPHACEWDRFTETFERVLQGALKPFDAIRELEISVPTYYRYKKQYEQAHPEKVSISQQ